MKPATTVSKICRIMAEFRTRPCMGVTELARRADLLPSDVHRILNSLVSYGMIEQNPANKTYRLGIGMMKLGLAALQRNELREASRSLLQRLCEEMDATAHMAIFDARELDIFLAEQIDSPGEIPFKPKYGATASPHSTALGKAIAANLDRKTLMDLIQKTGLPKWTAHTITQLSALEVELARTYDQGYSVDLEESAEGACCIGAPVWDDSGAVVAAVSISMPANRFYRFPQPQLACFVKSTAAELSVATGHRSISLTSRH
jgi:IclR family transcriptional regulator, KDG regulon repressor